MTAPQDRLQLLRSLPEASTNHPAFDPSKVKSNLSPDQLTLALNSFGHFMWHDDAYKANIGKGIVPLEFNVRKREDGGLEAETVLEAKVTKDMCNAFKSLSGGGAALIIDGCSFSSIIVLGIHLGLDTTGASQALNLVFHQAAPVGTTLRIVNTSLAVSGKVSSARSELIDKATGKLLVSGVHITSSRRAKAQKEATKL